MISIPEDRDFLLSQRQKGRPGSVGAADMVDMRRRQRAQERKEVERMRKKEHRKSSRCVQAS